MLLLAEKPSEMFDTRLKLVVLVELYTKLAVVKLAVVPRQYFSTVTYPLVNIQKAMEDYHL